MRRLKKIWGVFLDIFFPPLCLGCRKYLNTTQEKNDFLCSACFNGIETYKTVFQTDPHFTLMAVGSYEDRALKNLIHYFKYEGFLKARQPLEIIMVKYLEANPLVRQLPADTVIIPIPLHPSRLRKRGFNQAQLISEILSQRLNLPVTNKLLGRTRNTEAQIKVPNKEEREENIRGAFKFLGNRCPENVILVDDIYTSGATMKEAIKVLRRAGAKNITAFVIAKT